MHPPTLTRQNIALRWALLPALLAAVLLLGPGGSGSPRAAAAAEEPLTVLAAGDLRGEIEPCGCSPEGQMGGLPRRLTYLAQRLGEPGPAPILVDLGNNYPEPTAQGRHKIELIGALLGRFTPQAVLPGPGELALGVPALQQGGLPYVLSNDLLGGFPAVREAQRAGRRVGIYGYLSPQAVYQGSQSHFRLAPVDARLLADWRGRLRAAGHDATLLLFRGSDEELAAFVAAGLFDGIVTGNNSADELHQVTERPVAGQHVPQVPTKGQGVLRLALTPRGPPTSGKVDWLTERYADHPAAAPVFEAYNEAVKALFFAHLQTQEQLRQESPYVGAAACQACHAEAGRIWSGSRHSHALATLERVGKQYDPECLACHVVALERDGFRSQELTPQLANVQCESCHGPGRAHVGAPTRKPGPVPAAGGAALERPGEATCRTCHRGSHSPKFDFDVYWPRIAHLAPQSGTARVDAR